MNYDYNFDDENSINGSFFISPKYLQRSERGTFRDFTRYHIGGNAIYKNSVAFSNEFHNIFLAGFDEQFQDGAILFYNLSDGNGRGNELKTNKKEGANSFGIFLQDEILLNEKVSLIAGLRYDNITYYNQDFMKLNFKDEKVFEKITPKFGLSYRFDIAHTLYLNFGSGVEVPAGNETDPETGKDTIYLLNPLLEPIKSQTFEIGSKNIFLLSEGLIKFFKIDAAAYYINITDDLIPYQSGRFYFTAGKTSRIGIEAGAELILDYGLSLSAAFTFMNSKYDDYKIDSVHYDTTKTGKYADFEGNKVAGIPDLFYNLTVKYSIEQLNSLFVELNLEGIGQYFADDANLFEVPAYNILNLKIAFEKPLAISDNFYIRLFATLNNILNKKYAASAFINPDLEKHTGKPVYLEPGLPRNFVIGLSLDWK
jgi:iron complex outermembrane receptor protein